MKPGKIPKKIPTDNSLLKKYGKYLVAVLAIAAIVIVAAFFLMPRPLSPLSDDARFQQAGALYSDSVDQANAGNFTGALDDSNQALALNATPLIPLIQANRAGILVELGRNADAITAADAALAAKGNLTSLQSIAWLNKGNALCNLGMIDKAKLAYTNATALDPTLLNRTPPASSPCYIQS